MSNRTCTIDTLLGETRQAVRGVDVRVVRLVGELDAVDREEVVRSLVDGEQRSVVVDLSQLAFMDCGGYRALVDAFNLLDSRGASWTMLNATGEVARLLEIVGTEHGDVNDHTARVNWEQP